MTTLGSKTARELSEGGRSDRLAALTCAETHGKRTVENVMLKTQCCKRSVGNAMLETHGNMCAR